MQKQEQMQQALRYNNDMSTRSALSCFIISKLFLLLYVVVDLVISSLLFSRERAKQSTHLLHVTRVFQIVIAKFLKRLLVVFNPLCPKISMHILHTVLNTFPKEKRRRICLLIKSFISW